MSLPNFSLVNYGILDEPRELIRLHVSPATRRVYGFTVGNMIDLLRRNEYSDGEASQRGTDIITGVGKLVPLGDVPELKEYVIPDDWLKSLMDTKDKSTTDKGNAAVKAAKGMLLRGIIPISLSVMEVEDIALQIKGFDIFVNYKAHFQVKCDWKAGRREHGGSGNLFIQTQECNPFQRH